MKFGRNLPRNQVPEWAPRYIKYKALKKLIKSAAEPIKHGEAADTAGPLTSPLRLNLADAWQSSSTRSTGTWKTSMVSTTRNMLMQLDD